MQQKFFFLCMVFLFSACAGMKEKSVDKVDSQSKAFFLKIDESYQKREKISGSGSVSWKRKGRSSAVSGILLADWQKGMRLELLDPLGARHALVILNHENFWSYFVENAYALTGKASLLNTKKILPIPLTTEEFLRVFLARPPMLELALHEQIKEVEWDAATEQPLRWRISKGRDSFVEAQYFDYKIKSGIYFPGKIRIQYVVTNKLQAEMLWHWSDFEAYIQPLSQAFRVPPDLSEPLPTKTVK